MTQFLHDLVVRYDPDNDETDRRIFYEITGKRLIQGEFLDDDSSDEETAHNEDPLYRATSFDQVFDHKVN